MKIGRKLNAKNEGFKETVIKFAWTPKIMSNGDVILFEYYRENRIWTGITTKWDYLFYENRGYKRICYGWKTIEKKTFN